MFHLFSLSYPAYLVQAHITCVADAGITTFLQFRFNGIKSLSFGAVKQRRMAC